MEQHTLLLLRHLAFASPTAAAMLPVMPFLVSALADSLVLWATAGVLLPKALAVAETGGKVVVDAGR